MRARVVLIGLVAFGAVIWLSDRSCSRTLALAQQPSLSVTPTSLTFNPVVGQGSPPPQTLTVQNSGGGTMNFSIANSDISLLSVTPTSGTLTAGQSAAVLVTAINPNNVGTRRPTLTVNAAGAQNSPRVVNVTITTMSPMGPEIDVTPAALDFGMVQSGQSADRIMTVRNLGTTALVVTGLITDNPQFSAILPMGAFGEDISVDDGTFDRVTGPQGGGTIYCVNRLKPSSYPARVTRVSVYLASGSNGVKVGDALTVLVGANIDGDTNINQTTFQETDVTVQALNQFNNYDVPGLTISSGDLVVGFRMTVTSGIAPCVRDTEPPLRRRSYVSSDGMTFALLDDLGAGFAGNLGIRARIAGFNVAPGLAQIVTVRFTPTSGGLQMGRLSVYSNDVDESPHTVSLTGQGPPPDIDLTPGTLDFGRATVGQSVDRPLTVRNVGVGSLTVTAITFNSPRFSIPSPALPFTLAPNTQQTVTVRWNPDSPGMTMARLTVQSNDPDELSSSVQLRGEAVSGPDIDVIPTRLNFGDVTVGQTGEQAVMVRNTGGEALVVSNVAIDNVAFNLASPVSFTVAAGGQQPVMVRFRPTQIGPQSGGLTISSNDPDEATVKVDLSGAGVAPALPDLVVRNLRISQVNPRPGDEVVVSYTLQNQGAGPTEGNTFHAIVLSPDERITVADRLLGTDGSPPVPPGASLERSVFVLIPPDVPRGTMFLGVIADRFNTVPEPNEENNIASIPISIGFGVVRVFPASGASSVPLESHVELVFSLPLVTESVSPSTLIVRAQGGRQVSGEVTAANNRAFFFPDERLAPLTRYEVTAIGGQFGVLGRISDVTASLSNDVTSSFTTEAEADRTLPPSDGVRAVRVESGGTVEDDARTGAAVGLPPYTLKTDTVVTIEVSSAPQPVPGFVQVSDVVRLTSQPDGAVVFGPGMDVRFPLIRAQLGRLGPDTPIYVFQLIEAAGSVTPLDTGVKAERLPPPGAVALAAGVEVFGAFALYVPGDRDAESVATGRLSKDPHQVGAMTLYFPVISQSASRDVRLSLVNPSRTQNRAVTLTAYNDDGTMHSRQVRVVEALGQVSLQVSRLFPMLLSGSVVAQADGPIRGFYEVSDNFASPQMLDGAEAVVETQTALVFPLVRTRSGYSTEIHLFNPNDSTVTVRLFAFDSDGQRVTLDEETIMLGAHQRMVGSSRGGGPLSLPFAELDDGYVLVECIGRNGIVGAEVLEETFRMERNVAVLNAVGPPSSCLTRMGDCEPDSAVAPAARQHTAYAFHLEENPGETEIVVANTSDDDALIAFSAFDKNGGFLDGAPSPRAFLQLKAHQVLRLALSDLFAIDLASEGGSVRVDDPGSVIVGAVLNRDRVTRTFLTALPLAPDLAQDGSEATDAVFSRLEIQLANPEIRTEPVIHNPNNNDVRFLVTVLDLQGREMTRAESVIGRGKTTPSLMALFPGVTGGSFRIEAQADLMPGTGERLIPVVIYRSAKYVSAVPAQ